jgi:hypothetical protein
MARTTMTRSRETRSRERAPKPTGVATGRVADPPKPGPEHKRLEVFIGKWMTVGQTVASDGAPAMDIVASDVYEWVPGGFFVLHTAYGQVGNTGVGGVEMIGYDPERKNYRVSFFDSHGNNTAHTLSLRDGKWIWQGANARCTGVMSDNGRTMTAHHERSDDGMSWVPSMVVTLRKVE